MYAGSGSGRAGRAGGRGQELLSTSLPPTLARDGFAPRLPRPDDLPLDGLEGSNSFASFLRPSEDLVSPAARLYASSQRSAEEALRAGPSRGAPREPAALSASELQRLLEGLSPAQLDAVMEGAGGLHRTSNEWKSSFQTVLSKFAAERGRPSELRLGSGSEGGGSGSGQGSPSGAHWFASLPRSSSSLFQAQSPLSPAASSPLKKSSSGHDLRQSSLARSPSPTALQALRELRVQASGITENLSMLEKALLNAQNASVSSPSPTLPSGPAPSTNALPGPTLFHNQPPSGLTMPTLRENIQTSFSKTFSSSSLPREGHSAFLSSKLEQLQRRNGPGPGQASSVGPHPATPIPQRRAAPPQQQPQQQPQNGGGGRFGQRRETQQRQLNFTELNAAIGLPNGSAADEPRPLGRLVDPASLNFAGLDSAMTEVPSHQQAHDARPYERGQPRPHQGALSGPLPVRSQSPQRPYQQPQPRSQSPHRPVQQPRSHSPPRLYQQQPQPRSQSPLQHQPQQLRSPPPQVAASVSVQRRPAEQRTRQMTDTLLDEVDSFLVKSAQVMDKAVKPARTPAFPTERDALRVPGPQRTQPPPLSQPLHQAGHQAGQSSTVDLSASPSPDRSWPSSSPVMGLPAPKPKHHFREGMETLGLEPRSPRLPGPSFGGPPGGPVGAFPWAIGASGSVAERVSRFERFPVLGSVQLGPTPPNVVKGTATPLAGPLGGGLAPQRLVSTAPLQVSTSAPTQQQHQPTLTLQPAPGGKKASTNAGVPEAASPRTAVVSFSTKTSAPAAASQHSPKAVPSPKGQPSQPLKSPAYASASASAKLVLSPRNGQSDAPSPRAQPPLSGPLASPRGLASHKASTRAAKPPVRPGSAADIPRFHFPSGKPSSSGEAEVERGLRALAELYGAKGRVSEEAIGEATAALGLPLYWKRPLWLAAVAAQGSAQSPPAFLSVAALSAFWRSVTGRCHDEASRFFALLKAGRGRPTEPLTREDFEPLVQDIVDTFPGLYFLREASDFHSRYVQTVIARIFFSLNRSWSGRISLKELRNSNFLDVLRSLHTVEDINNVTEYFSYEHFYVIYCKFWDIDTDHDLLISKADLGRHEGGCLTPRIVERIFSGAVRPLGASPERMSYAEFVAFLIAEEDKAHPTSLEYWFRCLDLDGDGLLSIYEMEVFYEDVAKGMDAMSVEPMPFGNLVSELLDIVKPAAPPNVSLADLRRCGMAPFFLNSLVNVMKHYEQESNEGSDRANLRNEAGEPLSEWERYCADEYEALMAAEAQDDQGDEADSDPDPDPLSNSAPGLSSPLSPPLSSISQPFPLDAL